MRRRESLTLDMTPLVDVVFLLLIFFLVTSVFKKEELALLLNLPSVESGQKAHIPSRKIEIELGVNKIALNGQVVTMEELEVALAAKKESKIPVIVRIDQSVSYGRVAKILALLEKEKLENLSLITKAKNNH
ncbi:ExbD/TolR family protein [Hydrogenimonas sp.]